jgi:hypothetical protein
MTESSTELKLVKLLIVMQVHLELLDELQTTPIYRHNIKRSVNNLSKDLELQLNMLYKNMKTDNDVEEAYNAVKHGVDVCYLPLTRTPCTTSGTDQQITKTKNETFRPPIIFRRTPCN